MKKFLSGILLSSICMLLIGCTTINHSAQIEPICPNSRWAIAPFANNTEVPQAGNRAMSITANVLRSKGVLNIATYPVSNTCNQLTLCPNAALSPEAVMRWAEENNIHYVMMGTVNEWQYKVGLDGEPVAAVALQLYDAHTRRVVWSAVGSKIGSSRSGLGNVAQFLINMMLKTLYI